MATAESERVALSIASAEGNPADVLEACERELPAVADDSLYWQLLLAAWVANGLEEEPYGPGWLRLFQSTRRNRARGMKKAQRHLWNRLPERVSLYRADPPVDVKLSWTTSRAVAYHFSTQWDVPVVRRLAYRHEIAFYTDRRGEAEAVIIRDDPQVSAHLRGLVSVPELDAGPMPAEIELIRHRARIAASNILPFRGG